MSDTKSVVAGWFVDPLTGEFQNDVYLELDVDSINTCVVQQSLKRLLVDQDESEAIDKLRSVSHILSMINHRSRVQPCHVGLFEVPKNWTREDVNLVIKYLDESERQRAIRAYKNNFGHL